MDKGFHLFRGYSFHTELNDIEEREKERWKRDEKTTILIENSNVCT